MRHTILLILISNLFIFTTISQTESRYSSPLEIPLILSANFGELRPNHFHMGLDFKTNGKEGVKILAIDNGYISRIKISPYGYGKVVYINHPNGITSVYAHCSKLIGKLDSIVYATQKKEKNFEVEIFLQPNEIKILNDNNGYSLNDVFVYEFTGGVTGNIINSSNLFNMGLTAANGIITRVKPFDNLVRLNTNSAVLTGDLNIYLDDSINTWKKGQTVKFAFKNMLPSLAIYKINIYTDKNNSWVLKATLETSNMLSQTPYAEFICVDEINKTFELEIIR